jgi:hypothetical protein
MRTERALASRIGQLTDRDPDHRAPACSGLAERGIPTTGALLLPALDDDEAVRRAAATAAGLGRGPGARRALERVVRANRSQRVVDAAAAALRALDREPVAPSPVVPPLPRAAPDAPGALPPATSPPPLTLAEALERVSWPDPGARGAAVALLGASSGAAAGPPLGAALEDPMPLVRAHAAAALVGHPMARATDRRWRRPRARWPATSSRRGKTRRRRAATTGRRWPPIPATTMPGWAWRPAPRLAAGGPMGYAGSGDRVPEGAIDGEPVPARLRGEVRTGPAAVVRRIRGGRCLYAMMSRSFRVASVCGVLSIFAFAPAVADPAARKPDLATPEATFAAFKATVTANDLDAFRSLFHFIRPRMISSHGSSIARTSCTPCCER